MKTKLFTFVYDRLFNLFLYLSKFGYYSHDEKRIYDYYGLIDTLGWNSDETRFTWSYSCEYGCIFAIKLPFNYNIKLIDADGKEIKVNNKDKFK